MNSGTLLLLTDTCLFVFLLQIFSPVWTLVVFTGNVEQWGPLEDGGAVAEGGKCIVVYSCHIHESTMGQSEQTTNIYKTFYYHTKNNLLDPVFTEL